VGVLVVAGLVGGCRSIPVIDPKRLAYLEGALGQVLLVGFHGTEAIGNVELERLLCEARVGGVLIFGRNVQGQGQLARLTRSAAERSRACTARPLLVAVDAEGGRVMRLGVNGGWSPTLSHQALGEDNDFAVTELEARRIAARLRAAGINWNLAPVVDVGYNPANSVIVGFGRSFSANPRLVAAQARAYITGMHGESVLTALKHFPGHGSSYTDSHKGFVDVTETANAEIELLPYRRLMAEHAVDTVMTAHVVNRRLDAHYPATLSAATITGVLRGALGWDGVVVSDDLRMAAIEEDYGIERAAVLALAAGVDVLLIADDRLPDGRSAARVALDAVRAALRSGRLDPTALETSLGRIAALKSRID
jgi:beta-N-acetylhexosaminidase